MTAPIASSPSRASTLPLTRRMEDYLEAALILELEGRDVAVTTLAERLGVSKPSVVSCVKRLIEADLVLHEQYGKIHLTEEGRERALRVYRRHRFLCDLVGNVLSLPSDRAALLACEMEHHLDDETERHLFGVMDILASRFERGVLPNLVREKAEEGDDAPLPLSLLKKNQEGLVKHLLGDRAVQETGRCLGLVPGAVVRCLVPLGHEGSHDLVVEMDGQPRLVTSRTALAVWCAPLP